MQSVEFENKVAKLFQCITEHLSCTIFLNIFEIKPCRIYRNSLVVIK